MLATRVSMIYVHYGNYSTVGNAQSNIYNDKSRYIYQRHNIIKHIFLNEIIFLTELGQKKILWIHLLIV
jgi:hypothetical protein